MTISAFKKKDPEDTIEQGLIVCLNSDYEGEFPMTTTGEVKAGQVYCRWYDTSGCLQGDWFYPKELYLQGAEAGEVADFQPDFDLGAE